MKTFRKQSWILIVALLICVVYIFRWKFEDFSKVFPRKINDYYADAMRNYVFPDNKTIKVFFGTTFFGKQLESSDVISHCSQEIQDYCKFLHKKSDFEKADAVVFHARDYHYESSRWMFENRNTKIPYIIWVLESPNNEQNFPDFMNLTMSYDRKADIDFPYGKIRRKQKIEDNLESLENIWKMKKKSAESGAEIVWMVSNCKTPNRRMEIVQKMKKNGMKIDIFGACGIKPKNCVGSSKHPSCETNLISPYKFYISIENSNCQDYITEKFWLNAKLRFTIPIILGKQLYLDAGIPEKSFIALDDFNNLEEFKNFMDNLAGNKTKYLEFHEWRNEFEIHDIVGNQTHLPEMFDNYGFCKLCQNLKTGKYSDVSNVYSTLVGNWHKKSDCNNSIGYRFLNKLKGRSVFFFK